jgi:acetylornithine deacetylase/succinyl-diaminopimelate desuccinylase-like protein
MATFQKSALILLVNVCVLHNPILIAQSSKRPTSKRAQIELITYKKYFEDSNEAHLKEFIELLSIPSISSIPSHKADVEKAAGWIVKKLQAIGMTTAQVMPTGGLPVVFGCWNKAKGKPTVLIYAHYDVQPVKELEWDNPPFTAKIENGKIFARGASDDKSGVMIPIWAVEAMLKTDKVLPVNVKFIFDGEEESGSPNFHNFLVNNKELLQADLALNADGGQFSDSVPTIWMGLRGGAQLEFSVKTANF